ncbi:unnamed protein product [Haemonchus placei]|uniref:Na_H_Exchanger domain-containing protein n=1 Tax=Haemonchus placei TaxID=6290 RepID=A0A0N4WDP4_HAEPC|nr:unnamed protein product [Haemonchus placei]
MPDSGCKASERVDVHGQVTNANSQSEPLSSMDKEMKNDIVELYLGISVLMLGISSGELAGAFVFPALLEKIFDGLIEVIVLLLVPTYVYLNIRKNAAMDDTERRTCLFGFCLSIGILLGHLVGGALTSVAPSVFFIPPLTLSLLTVHLSGTVVKKFDESAVFLIDMETS